MGNRHLETSPIINKVPYLDIIRNPETGNYQYTPSLGGPGGKMTVGYGQMTNVSPRSREIKPVGGKIEINLLPEITEVPPPPIDAQQQVEEIIGRYIDQIINQMPPDANTLSIRHGSKLGILPETELQRQLRERGLKVPDGVFQIGGRKRDQINAIIFQRPLPDNK